MHILLSVLGWFLLALLAALMLALVLPVRIRMEYREGALSVRIQVFGLSFRVYPFPKRLQKQRPKKKKPKKEAAQSPKKKKKKAPAPGVGDIRKILGAAGTFVRRMYRMIHITDVILILPVHREDAAETALACGRAEAWLGGAAALLQNYFDLRIVQVRVLPDFTNEITAGVYLCCAVGARPIAFVAAGLHALVYLVRQMASSEPGKTPPHNPAAPEQTPPDQGQRPAAPEQTPPAPNRAALH